MKKFFEAIGIMAFFVAAYAIISVIAAVFVWLLWNWLMPAIFELPEITIFQAWGMMMLCSILFKPQTSK